MITGYPETTPWGGYVVWKDGSILDHRPSLKIYNHSPDGFAWGYGGSGPSQLALAILLEYTDRKFAVSHYQDFKADVIAKLPKDHEFTLTDYEIARWCETHGWLNIKQTVGKGI